MGLGRHLGDLTANQEIAGSFPAVVTTVVLTTRQPVFAVKSPDVYDRIKKDITEFPVFRFDWFFKSRTAQELSRRSHTLPGMISKEYEDKVKEDQQKKSAKGARGTVRSLEYVHRRGSI